MDKNRANLLLATEWSYHPYRPFLVDRGEVFITRIVPKRQGFSVSWLVKDAETVNLFWRKRDEGEYICVSSFCGGSAEVSGLEEGSDYEFYLQDMEGHKSLTRLVRTGDYICTPINYLHKDDKAYTFSGQYLASPSIVRQPDGSLLASMDVFQSDKPQNLTIIYRSDDNGATWQWQCELCPCLWGKLFLFHGEVYMLSCSTEHGDILLGKTTDGGKHFTKPTVLLRGHGISEEAGVDMSVEPPFEYGGRLWFNFHFGSWYHGGHHPAVVSAPIDADILDPASWTITPLCMYDNNWPGTANGNSGGTLEGTFLVLPDGELYMMARYDMTACDPNYGLAMLYKVRTDDPTAPLEYERTVPFDGNHSKFTVIQDEKEGNYYSIISRIRGSRYTRDRNLLSLVKSADGIHWNTVMDMIDMTDRSREEAGLQYVDFFIEGTDIYYAIRAGINEPDSGHNSNVILFGIIQDFRKL